jgi:AraC-like DNA-binding protein
MMQHVVVNPDIPQHLFVGSLEGVPSCTPESGVHDIWPKFQVMVLLQGAQHFVVDNHSIRIDAGFGDDAKPLVLMFNVARFAKLRFINDSTIPMRKVMISAPLPWIERLLSMQTSGAPSLKTFFSQHLASFRFSPSRHMLSLAEQLMNPRPSMEGEMRTLYRHSRALDIMCTACATLVEHEEEAQKPHLMSLRQSERAREFIVANLGEDLTIARIARETGASVSSVQRHFKEHFGVTVFEFIRARRLENASAALECDGATIAQAAFAAGYTDASAFATAFKKAYGVSPRQRRR